MIKKIIPFVVVLMILLGGCASNQPAPTATPDFISTVVAATLKAMTPLPSPTEAYTPTPVETSTPTLTPTPSQATVTGKVCYPSAGITELQVYFQNKDGGLVVELPVKGRQENYKIELAPGKYIAYAWLTDFSIGGLYSKAVACGLGTACTDHSALEFIVEAGQTFAGIDLCDWKHGPFDVPYPPGKQISDITGSISGTISNYPDASVPRLTVVAFSQTTPYWYWVGTAASQTFFNISNLPPGVYRVVAYDSNNRAGGNNSTVTVEAGKSSNLDINNWTGDYPPNPVK